MFKWQKKKKKNRMLVATDSKWKAVEMHVPCRSLPPEAPALSVTCPSATRTCRRLLCDPPEVTGISQPRWGLSGKLSLGEGEPESHGFPRDIVYPDGSQDSWVPVSLLSPMGCENLGKTHTCIRAHTHVRTHTLCSGLILESPSGRVQLPLTLHACAQTISVLAVRPWSYSSRERRSLPCPEPGFLHAAL